MPMLNRASFKRGALGAKTLSGPPDSLFYFGNTLNCRLDLRDILFCGNNDREIKIELLILDILPVSGYSEN